MAPPASSDGRDESEDERLDRNWDELLQELRVTQTGLQLLSGFLLTLPFTQVFGGLDDRAEGALPRAGRARRHRRRAEPDADHAAPPGLRGARQGPCREGGHVVTQIVIAAIAVLIVGMATLIFSVVVSWTAGIVVAAFLVVVLGVLLGVLPSRLGPGR